MSLDGRTAMKNGESKWITSKASREDVQMLRSLNQAILTGSGTIKSDNPMMTVRTESADSNPLRVVIDSNNIITDKSLNIFSSDAETLILNNNNSETLANGKVRSKICTYKTRRNGY